MDNIIKLITLILAISLAGERLVTFLKTLIPWLAGDPNATQPDTSGLEISRKVILMVLAFLSCWLTAYLVKMKMDDAQKALLPDDAVLGLLASSGSAFWTTILGYTKAVRDIKIQQQQQEKVNTDNVKPSAKAVRMDNRMSLAIDRIRKLTPPQFVNKQTFNPSRI